MRLLGFIPARGGSKRVRRKNLRILGGVTLVERAIEVARSAESLERIVVSSEDDEILAVAAQLGKDIPLRRPMEFASDTSPIIEGLVDAITRLEAGGEPHFDGAVVLHPTAPLRLPDDIDETVALLERSGASSAVSVCRVDHMIHPLKLKTMTGDRLLPYLEEERGRRMAHQLPPVFVRNCAVYVARRGLLDQGRLIGDDCVGHVMPSERSVDINEEIDLDLAELLLKRRSA